MYVAGVGLQRPLSPQNERRPGSICGHLTGAAAEEECAGDGLGQVLWCVLMLLRFSIVSLLIQETHDKLERDIRGFVNLIIT